MLPEITSPRKLGILLVLAHFSSLKPGTARPIKVIFLKLTRIDLSFHKVENLEIEIYGLEKHLQLGNFLLHFLQELAKMHLMVEWLSWLQDKHDFIKSNILKASNEVVRAKES